MIAVASLLLVVAVSMLVVRAGTVALTMTGLSEEIAQFQALSAFSGAGFTTSEAEHVVRHPTRRRVVALLMGLGSIGIVTAISSLALSFVGAGHAAPARSVVLLLGVLALITLARSRGFNRVLTPVIERALVRYATLELRDYADLLHLRDDYRIVEINVDAESWLASRQLHELGLSGEGVLVLGVVRAGGGYVGAPAPALRLAVGDRLIVYGRAHRLHELSTRTANDQAAHRAASAEHERDIVAQAGLG